MNEIQRFFSAEIRNSRVFFRPNTGDLQTKKKGLHRNSKGFSSRNQKFKGLFPAEITNSRVFFGRMQVISKQKKVSTKIQTSFSSRNQKFKVFFWPNAGDLQQKKRSSPKFKGFFWPKSGDIQKIGLHRLWVSS